MRSAALWIAFAVLAAGCEHGPKGSPDSTVESFFDAASDKDFEGMVACLAPESIKRIGSAARMSKYLETSYEGWKDFKIDIQDVRINADGKSGVIVFNCKAEVFNTHTRKYIPATCDDLYSVVKGEDDKWYVLLPESQKIKPML